MQIRTVTIHNFRSIVDGRFSLNDYSLLIGANNSGKSNIIDALRVFYEKDGYKYDPKRDRPLVPINDEEAWIEIVFVLNDDEAEGLKGEYLQPGNLLRVRKVLAGEPKPGIYAYEGAEISKNSFYGAKPVQQGKLGEVIYIQAVSRLEDETKLSGPSPLRDLLSQLLTDVLEGSTAFAKLTKEFQDFAQTVKCEQTDDERSISRLETEISNGIAEWVPPHLIVTS